MFGVYVFRKKKKTQKFCSWLQWSLVRHQQQQRRQAFLLRFHGTSEGNLFGCLDCYIEQRSLQMANDDCPLRTVPRKRIEKMDYQYMLQIINDDDVWSCVAELSCLLDIIVVGVMLCGWIILFFLPSTLLCDFMWLSYLVCLTWTLGLYAFMWLSHLACLPSRFGVCDLVWLSFLLAINVDDAGSCLPKISCLSFTALRGRTIPWVSWEGSWSHICYSVQVR